MRWITLLSTLAVAAATGPAALAQGADVGGTWELTTTAVPVMGELLPKGAVVCEYSGTAVVTQNGSDFSGPVELELDSGDGLCPGTMSGDVDGEVLGTELQMGMVLGGGLGEAEFTGAVNEILATSAEKGVALPDADGTFEVVQGPFLGTSGTWAAVLGGAPGPVVLEIPTLDGRGLALLTLLLAVAGGALLAARRRRARGVR